MKNENMHTINLIYSIKGLNAQFFHLKRCTGLYRVDIYLAQNPSVLAIISPLVRIIILVRC